MKVLQMIKKIITWILGIAFFGFAILMTVLLLNVTRYGFTKIENTSLIIVRGEISIDHYKKGDLVFVEGRKIKNISVGDELFVYQVDASGVVSIDVGIVEKTNIERDEITFKNGETYGMELVVGEATKTYNKIGTYLSICQSTVGFLFTVLIPSFLIFIYQLYALIVEIKYGKTNETAN